jgi:hypothetical protein
MKSTSVLTSPQVLEAPLRDVLDAHEVDVEEQRVDGEVTAQGVLQRSAKRRRDGGNATMLYRT